MVSAITLEAPKTRLLAKVLAQLGLTAKTLIVTGEGRTDVERAARNLRNVKIVRPEELSVYDVLRYDSLLIPERELSRLQEVWA